MHICDAHKYCVIMHENHESENRNPVEDWEYEINTVFLEDTIKVF